jgi:hypothetical protein
MKKDKKIKRFRIIKASGQTEPFSKRKLRLSLARSGLSRKDSINISDEIFSKVHEGAHTDEIYRKTLELVKKRSTLASVNYSLKKALFDLGPDGYFFETFVARYFEEIGFEAHTSRTFPGKYVTHEVDVVAKLRQKKYFVECKFHNRAGIKNDIKTVLYVKARWDDLKEGPVGHDLKGYYLASNTSFSKDAITYALGTGLKLLGVNSPDGESFFETVKKLKLFPLTSLKSLPRFLKKELMKHGIVVAKDLPFRQKLLVTLGLDENELEKVLMEVEHLEKGVI